MSCYHPVKAWMRTSTPCVYQYYDETSIMRNLYITRKEMTFLLANSRKLIFRLPHFETEAKREYFMQHHRELALPCGKCIGCRIQRSRSWAARCWHEAQFYEHNCFLTLTYAPEHLPRGKHGKCILRISDYQSFMKRFRIYLDRHHYHTKIRFFHCGEFGSKRGRSHYHSLIFGFDFPDKEFYKFNKLGQPLYRSPTLDKLWGKGICIIGELTYQSAGYVARYCMKKEYGNKSDRGPGRSEYITMSNRPGIGYRWFNKFKHQLLGVGFVLVPGKDKKWIKTEIPRYYLRKLKNDLNFMEEYDSFVYRKQCRAASRYEEYTEERLQVKEAVLLSRLGQLKREFENESE